MCYQFLFHSIRIVSPNTVSPSEPDLTNYQIHVRATVVPDEDFDPNRINTDRIKAVRSIISPLNTTYMLTSEQQFTFLRATTPAENMFLTQVWFG